MRNAAGWGALLSLGLMLAAPSSVHAAPLFGANLILNGDAEAGSGSASGNDVVSVPDWTTTGNFTVVQYNAPAFPTTADPGPASRGANFFAGGPNNASSNASQMIDVTAGSASIDAGSATFALEGFLGGFDGQDDNAVLTATFLNASNVSLGVASIGPVSSADRASATGLLLRNTSGALPIGTRDIALLLQMTRTAGAYNDGYADNLSLVLTAAPTAAAPEPSTLALLGAALFGLFVYGRRDRAFARCPSSV